MNIIVAGAGPGSPSYFTPAFINIVKEADIVLTSGRLADRLMIYNDDVRDMKVTEMTDFIKAHKDESLNVCVAATGDTGFYSIASTMSRNVSDIAELSFECGISSMAYFAAKIGTGYENMRLISLHGKSGSIVPYACYNKKVFALTGGAVTAADVIRQLNAAGLGNVRVHIGENLSLSDEKLTSGRASELEGNEFSSLAVVIAENEEAKDCFAVPRDEDFIRARVPMTKKAVRDLACAMLEVRPDDIVFDVGSGTGAMTCALARRASDSFVYAIEHDDDAYELTLQNLEKLSARNVIAVKNDAPHGMEAFPAPDKVFVGGSSGNLNSIVETVLQKNKTAEILVTAVSIDTLNEATTLFKDKGMKTDIICANISKARRLGNYDLMMAENPVYLIKGVSVEE